MIIMLTSCELGPAHESVSNVIIPIDERVVPAEGQVNRPVDIYLRSTLDNGCWSNISFLLKEDKEQHFSVWALADFESYGTCPTVEVTGDTILSFTPEVTGEHVFFFWKNLHEYETDTIMIKTAVSE